MREKGQLIFAVIILIFIFLLGGIIIELMPSEKLLSRRLVDSTQAFYLAQSGLQQAIYFVNSDPDLKALALSVRKFSDGALLSYTITENSGRFISNSYTSSVSAGEYLVAVSYFLSKINSGGMSVDYPVYRIRSEGYVPQIIKYSAKRGIEIYGNNTEINIDPFKFAIFAGNSVNFSGKSAVIEGERLPDGSFDTAIYSNGPIEDNCPLINGTFSPQPGKDIVENDNTLTMPILNDEYLKNIAKKQGLYKSGSNIDLRDMVNFAKENPNWYNASTNTWNTWSLVIYVDGSAEMSGDTKFQGFVIIKGDIKITGTGNKIKGIFYASSLDSIAEGLSIYGDPIIEGVSLCESINIRGNSTIRHKKDYIEKVMNYHGVSNVVQATKTKFRVLSWQEY
ncbi:MAG TPA: hypothetical protein PKW23_05200 [Dictyoglomaceae bacterium]|nr:hypothetical protein [Dictyoglomaceae bacterium]HPP15462.1 hypothetical protein [Dictyoglomaceae bacterium]